MGRMDFRRRAFIVSMLLIAAVAAYAAARSYSDRLLIYVVEQSLMQKAPPGTDPTQLRARFRSLLAGLPDRQSALAKALSLSQSIERVQTLTSQELEQLLPVTTKLRAPGPS